MEPTTPTDWDSPLFEDPKPRYRLCRFGFVLAAVALGLQCADIVLTLFAQFGGNLDLLNVVQDARWSWIVGSTITWCAFVGSLLLVGRWSEPRWRRRSVLLVCFNAFDVLLWVSHHGRTFGVILPVLQNLWVQQAVSVLQWFELLLFASLARDVLDHLGQKGGQEVYLITRAFATIGVMVWVFLMMIGTRWEAGWPLRLRPLTLETLLIHLGSSALLALTAFQVTLLCVHASRGCSSFLTELERAESDHELLKSRSELADDETFWNGQDH